MNRLICIIAMVFMAGVSNVTPAAAQDTANVIGTIVGAGAGGAIFSHTGRGTGRTVATIAGAAVGAVAGNYLTRPATNYVPTQPVYGAPPVAYAPPAYAPPPYQAVPQAYVPSSYPVLQPGYATPPYQAVQPSYAPSPYQTVQPSYAVPGQYYPAPQQPLTHVGYSQEDRSIDRSYCREYQETAMIGNRPTTLFGTACRQPNGRWVKID